MFITEQDKGEYRSLRVSEEAGAGGRVGLQPGIAPRCRVKKDVSSGVAFYGRNLLAASFLTILCLRRRFAAALLPRQFGNNFKHFGGGFCFRKAKFVSSLKSKPF